MLYQSIVQLDQLYFCHLFSSLDEHSFHCKTHNLILVRTCLFENFKILMVIESTDQ